MGASPSGNCYGYNFDSIVPDPDTDLLRVRYPAHSESGFRNVYLHRYRDQWRGDVPRFVAKVKVARRLIRLRGSASPHAHVCALHVLCWYRQRFGDKWREAITGRHATPKRPASPLAIEAAYDAESGGWTVRVWEFGQTVGVRGVRLRGKTRAKYDRPDNVRVRGHRWKRFGRLLVFPSERAAVRFAEIWLARRWGLFVEQVAWKVAGESRALAA